jgi:hypothetical protein
MKLTFSFRLLAFAVFVCLHFTLQAQNFAWALGAGGIGNEAANGVVVDEVGYTYVTGNLAGKGEFSNVEYEGKGLYDVLLAKYDAAGNLVWLKLAGGKRNDQGNAIRYAGGFLYVTGFFEDTAWFENTMVISKGEADVFTAKYDLGGNLVWLVTGGGTELDYATALDVDQQGNVYIAGSYEKKITFDTAQLTTTNFFQESFIVKYSPSGSLFWAKTSRGNNINLLTGIGSSPDGSVYATGFFGGNFSVSNIQVTSNSPSYDVVLVKLNDDGNTQWVKTAGSNYEDAANGIAVGPDGNPVIVGYFAGIATFGSNMVTYYDYNDAFIAKYDTSGNNLWVRAGKGQQLDVAYAVTVDSANNVFATGMFQGSASFDGYLVSGSDREVFLVSYTGTGNFRWIEKGGGLNTDCGLGLAVKKNGNVVVCGYYIFSCFFGNVQIDYADGNDLFIAEYTPPFISGLYDNEQQYELVAYPNPAVDFFNVKFEENADFLSVSVYDANGRRVYAAPIHSGQPVSVTGWSKGIYHVMLIGKEGNQSFRLVKH